MNVLPGTLSMIVLIWIGIAVLWAMRLAYRRRGSQADDPLRLILTNAGWALIIIGLLGTAAQLMLAPGILAWFVIIDTIFMTVSRYRAAERRTLMRCLAAAAERGIPLHEAAQAFAMERSDELGIRAARLAKLLQAGTPLSLALAKTRTGLPDDVRLATRLGLDTGDFAGAVTTIVKDGSDTDDMLNRTLERFFYLAMIAAVLLGILTFIMIKIVPVFAKMFEEFELELPKLTQLCVAVSEFFVSFGICFVVPVCLLFAGPILHRLLSYFGAASTQVPLLSLILGRFDTALVMRGLALGVQQKRPIGEMVGLLARHYPRRRIRRRLRKAHSRLSGGMPWYEALQRAKIISRADRAVLAAAGRSGNLQWALEEMAESNLRRVAYTLHVLSNVVFPLFLVLCGLIVAFFVISLFMPLVSLIQGLT